MPNGQLSDGRQAAHHASTGDTSRAAHRIEQRACIDRSADASRTIDTRAAVKGEALQERR
ncbi:hypothetical protein EGY19_22280 [Burkholderia multivorans]|nr:hypothetical protein EGY19_22280 [Burkholderia multivorans]PRF47691.1 hypothetical protein C6Q04_15740 [Burkholderia multivorans]PRF65287.1 hypothetical protein C6Q09_23345 [Burkholderia multivorans]PRG48285.1 hypothetical protein C6T63_23745 [Burkholderia multivorans]